MTGGATLVASGTAFLVWSILQGNNSRDSAILRQLEARTYTLTEDPQPGSLGDFLVNHIPKNSDYHEVFTSPRIPLDKLSNALSSWVTLKDDEKVIALVDSSFWDDAKKGVVFTDTRIHWKASGKEKNSIPYERLFYTMNPSKWRRHKDSLNDYKRTEKLNEFFANESNTYQWRIFLDRLEQEYPKFSS